MTKYALWYDNGSGYFDGHKLIEAASTDEAVAKAGEFMYDQVLTSGWDSDPNADGVVLALISSEAVQSQQPSINHERNES